MKERGIDERPNGMHRVRFMSSGLRKSQEFEVLDDAIRFRDAVYRDLADKAVVPVKGMSLRQAGPAFMARRKELRNYTTDKSRWNVHLLTAHFADRPLLTITRRDVLEYRDELEQRMTRDRKAKRPISKQLRKHCMNLLRAFFEYCVDREIMPLNPARGVRITGETAPIPDDWYLTPEEQERLYSFDGVERWIAIFAAGTGLRQGEQWNLRLSDLHLEGPDPYVMVRFGSDGRTPKSKKARTVALFGMGLEAARRWMAVLPGYAKKNRHGLMYPTKRGYRRGKSKVPRSWKAMVEHIGRHVHWHLLRHTCASSLVAGWWGKQWTLEEVKTHMGHSSITVTERYAHLAGSRLRTIARETDQGWSRDRTPPAIEPEIHATAIVGRTSKPNVESSNLSGRTAEFVASQDQGGTSGLLGSPEAAEVATAALAKIRAARGALRVA